MALNLAIHAGGHRVTREQVVAVQTPEPTRSWCPIPHGALVDGVQHSLERAGYKVAGEAHATSRDASRYFGLLELTNGHAANDYGLVVGLRNSHDKTFPAGLVVGSQVFVCDNLAFSGEVKIARKHTTHIMRDLPQLIDAAVGRLAEARGTQDARIATYKARELSDGQAHDLVIQAMDARICGPTMIPSVVQEWRTPRHKEFADGKTAWRLFNAFTEVLKVRPLFLRPRATQALHGLMDITCGVVTAGPLA